MQAFAFLGLLVMAGVALAVAVDDWLASHDEEY